MQNLKPNEEMTAKVLCTGTALLVLAVLTVNPFTLLYAIFLLISARSIFIFWKEWRSIVFVFYVISLVVTIVWIVANIMFIADTIITKKFSDYDSLSKKDIFYLVLQGVLVLLATFSLWLLVISHTHHTSLYVDGNNAPAEPSLIGDQYILSS